MKAETIFDANSAKNWGFISSINDYQNLFNMSKLKQVLFDAFGIQMKAMKVVGADGKELEINKDSGAPAVGRRGKSPKKTKRKHQKNISVCLFQRT